MNRERLRALFVWAVVLHSACVGLVMFSAPGWTVTLGGFESTAPFFVRQGGVFHLIVAAAYLWEFQRLGTLRLLVLAKGAAALFLGLEFAFGSEAWAVPLAGLGDGVMLAVALWLGIRPGATEPPVEEGSGPA